MQPAGLVRCSARCAPPAPLQLRDTILAYEHKAGQPSSRAVLDELAATQAAAHPAAAQPARPGMAAGVGEAQLGSAGREEL